MKLSEKRALEKALQDHYRPAPGLSEEASPALVRAVAAELERPARPRAFAIVAGQARRIGAAAWALHAALLVFVAALALTGVHVATAAGAIGAAFALASLTEVTRSRACGMAELEASCAVNAQAVACARAVVLGCADALALVALALLAAEGPALWMTLAQACAPYLAAAGAGLLAARKVASADATAAAVVAAAGVCAACVALRLLFPTAFAPATGLAWWLAAVLAFAFAAAEVRAWLRAAGSAFADTDASARAVTAL